MKGLMTVFFVILFVNLSAQKHTLFGYIKDKTTGESLIGASISVNDKSIGTISNNYGFYSIAIPAGKQLIKCSYIGYQVFNKEIELQSETNLNIELEPKNSKLQEVVITSSKNNKITNNEMVASR
jgi:hypothetical protein